ncbi:putative protein phosphatase 2C 23 [Cinnamomum micranthum f. kanehirae]|uniref:protein-serine/threonine phosphatase n=1 Tax=Cinnamomum micranthum f. kanehirae TaxID=337451 RepID=A0A3S3Q005_9MAGN|nr:putative protein phosphatase 2C 23 [Cinnamomum micranthum f. kanehirae]
MGNGIGKLSRCFSGSNGIRDRHDISVVLSGPLDEGLGHSFCYVRPDPSRLSSSKVHHSDDPTAAATTTFRSISGASLGANTATPLSTADPYSDRSPAAFESSNSFASIPLQPVPRLNSGPLPSTLAGIPSSGPMERGFMSGPIERGFMSGPLDRSMFSAPLDRSSDQFPRSLSHGANAFRHKPKRGSFIGAIRKAISRTIGQNSMVAPVKFGLSAKQLKELESVVGSDKNGENLTISSTYLSSDLSMDDECSMECQNLQWAQGKAGEDRVHVVVSEEHGWVFVGIYDGFNGPDAPDYLLSNLYSAVHKELKGLLWEDKFESPLNQTIDSNSDEPVSIQTHESIRPATSSRNIDPCSQCVNTENYPFESDRNWNLKKVHGKNSKNKFKGAAKKWEENQRRWKCEWDRERLELERRLKEQMSGSQGSDRVVNHSDVLKALSQALKKTEEAYLEIADKLVVENPELALMGSCVLVMLMKGDDVYLMNVGDSRAVLAQKADPDLWGSLGKGHQDLERINEETLHDLESSDIDQPDELSLTTIQLTLDHSTSVEEEVRRIKNEHQDDACAIVNDRVKGSLKVTRAFGAGFLKQPKWNDALLEMFRIDYVGSSPYITCTPSLFYHRLGPKDRFLILSSDGLYQYFTNEEAVAQVELFITSSPDGDPAQHLVEEVLFRAAKKAGMDFHELLEIPHGHRRRYHDDVSIIVISLEGRIWRSCV